MRLTSRSLAPPTPIFTVEIIDPDGFAWMCGPLFLHEAIRIAQDFERDALPGQEPRISFPPLPGPPCLEGKST